MNIYLSNGPLIGLSMRIFILKVILLMSCILKT